MDAQLTGVLERIIFYNEENHFTIGEIRPEKERGLVTVTGSLPGVQCGETLKLGGSWTKHPVHGNQFRITSFKSQLPATVYGIKKYLGSGLIPNVGPKFAEKIVDHFGAETLQIISDESARLREVPGVGKKRAKEIKSAWDEQSSLRDVMMFLQTYGVTTNLCLRLIRMYGNSAKQILQDEPYRVAREIRGIGFRTADKIAVNLGYSNESPPRLEAGLIYALQEKESEGHTCCARTDLEAYAAELLEVEADLLKPRIEALIESSSLVSIEPGDSNAAIAHPEAFGPQQLLQLPVQHRAESSIAGSVNRLLEAPSALPSILVDKAVAWAQEKAGFDFAPEQALGVKSALEAKVSIITGGPGTGKTTILRAIVDILKAKKVKILQAAPTGRAAQRMNEATHAFAQTIHRLLKYDANMGGFASNEDNPLKTDFLIVDEASMLDSKLAAALIRSVPNNTHLLLVGDVHQLPSVGAGNVLQDLILHARKHPQAGLRVTKLEQVFRQGKRSSIVHVAHHILEGQAGAPAVNESLDEVDPRRDLHFLKTEEAEGCVETILKLCRDYLPRWYSKFDVLMDVQVLPPMHKGVGGIHNLNHQLQSTLNGEGRGITLGNNRYQVGDKVIQMRNNYDKNLFNGDLGKITAVNPEAGTLAADFDGVEHDFARTEVIDLQLAYAISIHKSQGSEFPVVIIPLLKQHFVMLQRNLLYTGITRGRKKVFIVGDPAAYSMAVRNREATQRITDLLGKLSRGALEEEKP